jgi:hypothetical protein
MAPGCATKPPWLGPVGPTALRWRTFFSNSGKVGNAAPQCRTCSVPAVGSGAVTPCAFAKPLAWLQQASSAVDCRSAREAAVSRSAASTVLLILKSANLAATVACPGLS